MPRRKAVAKPVIPGKRTGSKRSDFRWTAPDGTIWGSRFEFEVFTTLTEQGYAVRKTTSQDSMAYTSPVRGGRCQKCDSDSVAQEHVYTPDLYVDSKPRPDGKENESSGYYIESKGYLRGSRRALLRHFRKARADVDLRLVIQRDYKVGKGTLVSWAEKYLKVKVLVWKGSLTEGW